MVVIAAYGRQFGWVDAVDAAVPGSYTEINIPFA
jgi:hypothetical protein